MSLYDDILPTEENEPEKEKKVKAWASSSINLLQHHLQNRKQQNKNLAYKPRQTIIPNANKSKVQPPTIINTQQNYSTSKFVGALIGGEWNVNLEYDPLWPNDYEKLVAERKEKITSPVTVSKPKQNFYNVSPKITSTLGSRPLVDAYSDDEEESNNDSFKKPIRGAAIAPPPSLTESSAVNSSETNAFNNVAPPASLTNSNQDATSLNMNVSDVAAKIMARMGYKEGKGLGKNQQGIATALQVEKTSKNSGVIISSSSNVNNSSQEDSDSKFLIPNIPVQLNNQGQESITEIMKNPTKVIMLQNMVGQGEVDPDLEPEVKEECSKFGEVANCLIYEVNEGLINGKKNLSCKNMNVPDDQAVRIFVEFTRVESSIKALVDLNGRYFGGRIVKGLFYDLDKFKKMDLAG